MTQLDLASLHEAIAAALPDEPCIIADRTLSWSAVTDRTRRLAAVLRGAGLGRRRPADDVPPWETGQDHLGILLHNSAEYLEALLGAHKASVVPFNINYRYTAEELAYLLRDATPAALVFGEVFADLVAEVVPSLERRPLLVQVGGEPAPGVLAYEAALAAADPADGIPAGSPDDRYLLYTGGTTGMPKGVIWRVGDMLAGPSGVRRRDGQPITDLGEAVDRALGMRGRVLPAPPLMHGAGTGIALGGWFGGATVVIQPHPDRFDAATLLDTVAAEQVTTLMIVGDAFGALLVEELRARPRDLSSLRVIVNSGAALRDELKDQLRELVPGLRITDMLGSSETGIHARRGEGNRYDGRGTVTVLSEDRTRVLEPGSPEVGWLAQGGNIPLGYLGDPDKTRGTFIIVESRRFSVPGDRARLAADGFIEFLGREATTINTGGEKVFADEVELVLRSVPGVVDAVVLGRPSERWGQEVVAVVELSPGIDDASLSAGCREKLAGYKVPKAFLRVEKIQRHANGKPDYAWAKEISR